MVSIIGSVGWVPLSLNGFMGMCVFLLMMRWTVCVYHNSMGWVYHWFCVCVCLSQFHGVDLPTVLWGGQIGLTLILHSVHLTSVLQILFTTGFPGLQGRCIKLGLVGTKERERFFPTFFPQESVMSIF